MKDVGMNPSGIAMTDEERRQYGVAAEFIKLHPEYDPTLQNSNLMVDWMEVRDMKMTLEGLEIAYKAVFRGEPEPEVMSPDLFFSKVQPIDFSPPVELSPWKPMSTGLNTRLNTGTTTMSWDDNSEWEDSQGWGVTLAPDPEVPKIPVRAMPSSWYNEDVVEIQTTRRIKDTE